MFNAIPTTNATDSHHQTPRTLPGREGQTLGGAVEDALKYASVPLSTWYIAARDANAWNKRIHSLNTLRYEHAPDPSAADADRGVQNAARTRAKRRTPPSVDHPTTTEPITNPVLSANNNNNNNTITITNPVLSANNNTDLLAQLLAETKKTAHESSPSRRSSRRIRGLSPTIN
jgi:hypothetical protein